MPLLNAFPLHFEQDEFKFFLEDAGSKLLVLPPRGLKEAQTSADGLRLPSATLAVSWSLGTHNSTGSPLTHQLLGMDTEFLLSGLQMKIAIITLLVTPLASGTVDIPRSLAVAIRSLI